MDDWIFRNTLDNFIAQNIFFSVENFQRVLNLSGEMTEKYEIWNAPVQHWRKKLQLENRPTKQKTFHTKIVPYLYLNNFYVSVFAKFLSATEKFPNNLNVKSLLTRVVIGHSKFSSSEDVNLTNWKLCLNEGLFYLLSSHITIIPDNPLVTVL